MMLAASAARLLKLIFSPRNVKMYIVAAGDMVTVTHTVHSLNDSQQGFTAHASGMDIRSGSVHVLGIGYTVTVSVMLGTAQAADDLHRYATFFSDPVSQTHQLFFRFRGISVTIGGMVIAALAGKFPPGEVFDTIPECACSCICRGIFLFNAISHRVGQGFYGVLVCCTGDRQAEVRLKCPDCRFCAPAPDSIHRDLVVVQKLQKVLNLFCGHFAASNALIRSSNVEIMPSREVCFPWRASSLLFADARAVRSSPIADVLPEVSRST
nr:MAG TPA: hypothetical protein [Caudoviricetes sp.]